MRWRLRSRVLLSRVGTRCRPVSRHTPKHQLRVGVRWIWSTRLGCAARVVGNGSEVQQAFRRRTGDERQLGSRCVRLGRGASARPSPLPYFCPVLDGCSGGDFGARTHTHTYIYPDPDPYTHTHTNTYTRTRARARRYDTGSPQRTKQQRQLRFRTSAATVHCTATVTYDNRQRKKHQPEQAQRNSYHCHCHHPRRSRAQVTSISRHHRHRHLSYTRARHFFKKLKKKKPQK